MAEKYLVNYGFKPSDSFHIATMEKAGATLIVSEDKDFDKVAWIKRVWPTSSPPKEL
jgi:predicted nucleic acid-binding protein